jgi:DNA repair protein RecO (recombination protein O)
VLRTQTKGLVIRRQEFGEADRIVTLLTKDLGKVSAIAKGSRRLKSKLAAGIELFSLSDFTLIHGRSKLLTISSAKLVDSHKQLVAEYERISVGSEIFRHINKLIEEEEGAEFYPIISLTINSLDDPDSPTELAQAWFYMQTLKLMGHAPNLTDDSSGKDLEADQNYVFDPIAGTLAPTQMEVTILKSEHIKTWRLLLEREPKVLSRINGLSEAVTESLPQLQNFFEHQLY